jgi:glycosyltransferase involved in cell wall biosynthesis
MKKILLISSNLSVGGAQKFISNIANELIELGFKVSICTLHGNGKVNLTISINKKVEINCINRRSMFSVFALSKQMKSLKPDVIISTQRYVNISVVLAYLISGTRAKLTIREASLVSKYNPLMLKLSNYLYSKATRVIVQTEQIKKDLLNSSKLLINTTEVVPNFINHKKLMFLSKEYDLKRSKQKVFLYVGRIEKVKNVDVIVRALEKVHYENKGFELWIVGDGKDRVQIEDYCEKMNLTFVKFFGMIENPYPFMLNADCLIMASEYEGFPNVMIEAMALRCITLVNNFGGGAASEILTDDLAKYIYNNDQQLHDILISIVTSGEIKEVQEKFYNRSLYYSHERILPNIVSIK